MALEELYNSMDSGEEKESLGSNIEEWKANLQMYEDDLSLLDENAVIKIKFAYDNAQLQQEVDNSLALAEASGQSDSAVSNYIDNLTYFPLKIISHSMGFIINSRSERSIC